ncbi:unnamed protein product [Ectocarpus sp. 8 AP-2014]
MIIMMMTMMQIDARVAPRHLRFWAGLPEDAAVQSSFKASPIRSSIDGFPKRWRRGKRQWVRPRLPSTTTSGQGFLARINTPKAIYFRHTIDTHSLTDM